ncbi:imelysin family protein [Thiofilum flexile]|uniref:imelysin family protein n=1 Tax=Thiofilum flexile TaxID=125627 RepID=UPI000381870E|nr:imelysin family protein [Thiofilum flexile]
MIRKTLLAALVGSTLVLATPFLAYADTTPVATSATPTPSQVITQYADIAYANYADSLSSAKALQTAINAFIAAPSAETQQAAKTAWIKARAIYSQTEVFRFGNPNVDDWEGQVNAWPLDEGLIDYVQADAYEYEDGNKFATANIIAGTEPITSELLKSYQEKGGSEANVAIGYHAVEFLLWGQDLNTDPKSAGQRSYTDYLKGEACSNGHCERRAEYLKTVTDLLVQDLETMVKDWAPDQDNYRKTFLALDEKEAMRRVLFGMGSLSLGELAGQRMNVALLAHSQEDEHSCFSDNTHDDIFRNIQGIQNVYTGYYVKADGSVLEGANIAQLVASKEAKIDADLKAKLTDSLKNAEAIVSTAQAGSSFDQQIAADNANNALVKATIDALKNQTAAIESAAGALGIQNLNPEPLEEE